MRGEGWRLDWREARGGAGARGQAGCHAWILLPLDVDAGLLPRYGDAALRLNDCQAIFEIIPCGFRQTSSLLRNNALPLNLAILALLAISKFLCCFSAMDASTDLGLGPERTLADRAYRRLRHDIVAGHLPPGSKLKLEGLVQDYGVGMAPVREALARLAGDLLVVTEGQRGCWVPELSIAELDDLTCNRSLLESEAIVLSIQHGGAEWEAGVRTAFERLQAVESALPAPAETLLPALLTEWESCNRAFHAALVAACGSPWLIKLRKLLYQQSERYRWVSLRVSRGRRSVAEEHEALFEAAMSRNILRAMRMTDLHVRRTAEEVRHALRNAAGAVQQDLG